MGALIHHLMRCVKLLTNIVPCVLSLAEAPVCNLQLPVLVGRRNGTTTKKIILTHQLCELPRCGGVALLISSHLETLLNNCHVGAVL
jgi:hypothetical protein